MPQQCPHQLWRLYRWHRVQNEVPRWPVLSLLCQPPRQKIAKKARARNRAKFMQRGLVCRGDSMHIHHIDGNNKNNRSSNLKVMRASSHRRLHKKARRR